MKKLYCFIVLCLMIGFRTHVAAQSEETFDFEAEMAKPGADYYDIVKRGTAFYEEQPETEGEDGDKEAFYRWAAMWKDRVTQEGTTIGDFNRATQSFQNLLTDPVCNGSLTVTSQWTPLGPMSMPLHEMGVVTSVAALPTEPNVVYAGSSNGGLFRTTQAAPGANPPTRPRLKLRLCACDEDACKL